MTGFQAFKADSGEYRWRLVENGCVVPIRPGRVHVTPLPKRTRKRVESALNRALASLAGDEDASRTEA